MTRIGLAVGALVLLATVTKQSVAQPRNPRLVATEPGRMMIPLCQLRVGGKVNDGQKELRTGIEDRDPAKRAAALAKAEQILAQAVGEADAQNPAAWYYLGRTYLALGDVRGADSALTRAEALAPDCELDIDQYRQNAWAELANAGIELQQAGRSDSAIGLFREASVIFGGLPHVFENMGVMFANAGMNDSAALYFEKAMAAAETDTALVSNRNSSALNLALMYQRLERHGEAVGVLRRFMEWNPQDTDARRSLASSLREMGQVDSAEVIERQLVEEFASLNPDSLSSADLMAVGVSHFNSGTVGRGKIDSIRSKIDSAKKTGTADLPALEAELQRLENELRRNYLRAGEIFAKLQTRNPWSRDAVFNLANTYLALNDNENLVATSRRLVEIEPLNEDGYRLLASGFRELQRQDSLVATAERLVALPVDLDVTLFALGSSGARWTATATGREATDAAGKPLPPVPVACVLEFLDEAGNLVATEEVSIPALQPGATHDLQVEVRGENIAAWRYRRR